VCRQLIKISPEVLLVSVLVEADHWIHARLHAGVLVALLEDIADGAYVVADLRPEDYRRLGELCDHIRRCRKPGLWTRLRWRLSSG
jgi:hypothetical protein